MPPSVFSTLTSPIVLLAWLLTFLRSSRFAGIASFKVVLRSGSEAEENFRIEGVAEDKTLGCNRQDQREYDATQWARITCSRRATLGAAIVESMARVGAPAIARASGVSMFSGGLSGVCTYW